jgi:hypothetical protein
MEVDVEKVGRLPARGDDVAIPDLLRKRRGHRSAHRHDLDALRASWGFVLDNVADRASDQRLPEGRARRDDRDVISSLLDRPDEVLLDLVVALVPESPLSSSTVLTITGSSSIAWSWRMRASILPWASFAAW